MNSSIALTGVSFDHLVGAGQKGGWHGDAKRTRCFQIDGELDARWLLEGKVCDLGSAQKAIDVIRKRPVVCGVDAVSQQSSAARLGDIGMNGGQFQCQALIDDEALVSRVSGSAATMMAAA